MFEQELAAYHKNLDRLREENPSGGFVIIKDDYIYPIIWLNISDAERNGNRLFGKNSFLIGNIHEEKSPTFEELCSAISSQKEQIPSLIEGGFTNSANSSSLLSNTELRKYCLDKAIEIFNMKKDFFLKLGEGPLEYAEVLYSYITTGTITDFQLPGMRKTSNQQATKSALTPPEPITPQPI